MGDGPAGLTLTPRPPAIGSAATMGAGGSVDGVPKDVGRRDGDVDARVRCFAERRAAVEHRRVSRIPAQHSGAGRRGRGAVCAGMRRLSWCDRFGRRYGGARVEQASARAVVDGVADGAKRFADRARDYRWKSGDAHAARDASDARRRYNRSSRICARCHASQDVGGRSRSRRQCRRRGRRSGAGIDPPARAIVDRGAQRPADRRKRSSVRRLPRLRADRVAGEGARSRRRRVDGEAVHRLQGRRSRERFAGGRARARRARVEHAEGGSADSTHR